MQVITMSQHILFLFLTFPPLSTTAPCSLDISTIEDTAFQYFGNTRKSVYSFCICHECEYKGELYISTAEREMMKKKKTKLDIDEGLPCWLSI